MENIVQNHENTAIKVKIYQVKNERMGGFVPSWDKPKEEIDQNFDNILSSYSPIDKPIEINNPNKNDEFGLLDIIDIINPLQHIPLVNMAYRAITGDQIKSSSQVIGGSIFGGPVGGATGLVSAIIKEETGKDIIGNVKSFARINDKDQESFNSEYQAYKDLPASLLAFSQTPINSISKDSDYDLGYKRTQIAQGRTAGTIAVYS